MEKEMAKFLQRVEKSCENLYKSTEIFMGNHFDLIEIDMSKIPRNCFFISDHCIEKGIMFKVDEGELKRMLYDFIEQHPDRVFRGEKSSNIL